MQYIVSCFYGFFQGKVIPECIEKSSADQKKKDEQILVTHIQTFLYHIRNIQVCLSSTCLLDRIKKCHKIKNLESVKGSEKNMILFFAICYVFLELHNKSTAFLAADPRRLLNQCPESQFLCAHVLTVRDV